MKKPFLKAGVFLLFISAPAASTKSPEGIMTAFIIAFGFITLCVLATVWFYKDDDTDGKKGFPKSRDSRRND